MKPIYMSTKLIHMTSFYMKNIEMMFWLIHMKLICMNFQNSKVCTTHNTFSSVCHIDPVCCVGFIQNCLASMSCGSDKVGWIFTKIRPAIVWIHPDWLFTSRNLGADVKSFFWSWILIDLWYNLGAVTLVKSLYPWVCCAFDNVLFLNFA